MKVSKSIKIVNSSGMKRYLGILFWFLVVLLSIPVKEVFAYTCFPTCENTDGVFISKVKNGALYSFADLTEKYFFIASEDSSTLEIGIFDGDSGKNSGNLHQGDWWYGNWDTSTHDIIYRLYTDPDVDGVGDELVGEWNSNLDNVPSPGDLWSCDTPGMPNNDWWTVEIQLNENAQSPSGSYVYLLEMVFSSSSAFPGRGISAHKFRTDGYFKTSNEILGVIAVLATLDDFKIMYHEWDGVDFSWFDDYDQKVAGSYYSGIVNLYYDVFTSTESFRFWDGDWDYGAVDGSSVDTDDPNTPGSSLPSFITGGALVEDAKGMGQPGDDSDWPVAVFYPSVTYNLATPAGVFQNSNPSGSEEWELFEVGRNLDADHTIDDNLDPGLYRLETQGLDTGNTIFFYNRFDMIGVNEAGEPQIPPRPYEIGSYVWHDENEDGNRDSNETGIPDVHLNIYDSNNFQLESITTDPSGEYLYGVEEYRMDPNTSEIIYDGIYKVEVDESNYDNVLEGYELTTSSEALIYTVNGSNVLTYNFGYAISEDETLPETGLPVLFAIISGFFLIWIVVMKMLRI